MQPVPPIAPADIVPPANTSASVDQGELTRLIIYFETGLAELDRLGLAHSASHICWGIDVLKEQREP